MAAEVCITEFTDPGCPWAYSAEPFRRRLNWLYGDALEWKYVQGLSVKEIAARLNLGAKAAESLMTRARQAFRDGAKDRNQRRTEEEPPPIPQPPEEQQRYQHGDRIHVPGAALEPRQQTHPNRRRQSEHGGGDAERTCECPELKKGGDAAVFKEGQATQVGGWPDVVTFQTQVGMMPGDAEGTLGTETNANRLQF